MNYKLIAAVALACSACAGNQAHTGTPQAEVRFQTVDNTSPISDYDAASYYGVVIAGERLGEVAVWSNGAFVVEDQGERVPVLELTVLARNESQTPFALDLAGTAVRLDEGLSVALDDEYAVAGTRVVQPGETRRLGLRYRLPKPGDISRLVAFDFTWSMRAGEASFAQITPFRFLPPGQFELGAEWPLTKRLSFTQDNRRPWTIRWSALTPEEGDQPVYPGDEPPPFKWQTPPAKTEQQPPG